ncbi:DUF2325 domain-containing protein [Haematospirillum sp. 15-248]|uniref:DUF2325 domain-containing protein n=1 Tax=Haematospirillum sp. 15-248 TaxID=2723107 RepID=UPI00143A108A|nr:DUF2325 domain-containing protein [Haematospirillum sp. 15-248]NKD87921.1 DUF2325 domain-containing protein [Haematospirillum sp. 15-248]
MSPMSLPKDFLTQSYPLSSRRLRLDEIAPRWHCSIVGTCLTLSDLRKLAAKLSVHLAPDISDYRLHGVIVHLAAQNKILGKQVMRILDKRYQATVSRFMRTRDEGELATLWNEALDSGDIPGAYWALMTHPLDCSDLRERAYGEVHMLSHLSGAVQRADMQKIVRLEASLAEHTAEIGRLRALMAQMRDERDEARRNIAIASIQQRRVEDLASRLADLESGEVLRTSEEAARTARAERDVLARQVEGLLRRLDLLSERESGERERNRALEARVVELENRLRQEGSDSRGAFDGNRVGDDIDLKKQKILYVGGISHVARHLEDVVRSCNGEFIHHDGGLDDGCPQLAGAVSCVDMVFCPVTCVSHEAMVHIKRNCRKACKLFVPLPNHSISTFRRVLGQVHARMVS